MWKCGSLWSAGYRLRCWGRSANDNISQVSIEAAEAGEGNVIKFYSRIIFIQLQSSRGRHVVIITPRSKLQTALYLCIVACVRTLYKPGPGPGSWSAPVWCWITEQLLESVNWANTSITPSLSSMWPAAGSTLAIVRTRSQHGHNARKSLNELEFDLCHQTSWITYFMSRCPLSSWQQISLVVTIQQRLLLGLWPLDVQYELSLHILYLCGDCGYSSSSQPAPHAAGPGHGKYLLLTKTQTCKRFLTMFGTDSIILWDLSPWVACPQRSSLINEAHF